MAERVTFDGQRQREALEHFQEATGLDATAIAQAVNLSYPQYNRYRWGKVPLRTDQVPIFAAAYGVTTAELTQALGLMDDAAVAVSVDPSDDPDWDFRTELRRAWPHDAAFAEQTYRDHVSAPQFAQRAVVDALRRVATRDQDALIQESGQQRVAEDRAEYRFTRTG